MAGLLRRLIGPWRRSLQLRVVSIALLLGALAVSAVGFFLFTRFADGLTADRVETSRNDAAVLAARAQGTLDQTDATGNEAEINNSVRGIIAQLIPSESTDRYVVLTRALGNDNAVVLDTVLSGGLRSSPVPVSVAQALDADSSRQQTTVINLDRSRLVSEPAPATWTRPDIPAVVVGQQIQVPTAGAYNLSFIYPMDREQATLDLIQRLFGLGGLSLVTLLAAIAWLVTRMVVAPVRRASEVAERLTTGHLNERMSAGGADDLAILARSFNGMADNLQSQIRQLEDLSQVQQVFVSDVSHELRTPLTTIRMAADVLHDTRHGMPAHLARSVELLSAELDRFEALLGDLLEISRFDAKAAALELDSVDLGALVQRVVAGVSPLADRRGSALSVRVMRAEVFAEADARRVERIVRNLVVNAIEHGEGRPIQISVAQNASAAAIAVQDGGVGLRPGEALLVFNRFWRADPARARTTGGTGLGLAISLEDARLHDGRLEAWGEPGRGSVFRLTLPRVAGLPIQESPLPLIPPDRREETTRLRPVRLTAGPT